MPKDELHLRLTARWYNLIDSGKKKDEYREIKKYWTTRLTNKDGTFKKFKTVRFTNGFGPTRPTMVFNWNGIRVGRGVALWGAPDNDVYIISLEGGRIE